MEEIELDSKKVLKVTPAPFSDARDLYQAFLLEIKDVRVNQLADDVDMGFIKDAICSVLSSKRIEEKLFVCMKRCTYDGMKIDKDTFEPIEAREDYFQVCYEIARVNIFPFTKSLFAKYAPQLERMKSLLK